MSFSDFSDRISKSKRVGYESGEYEIVSTVCFFHFFLTKCFALIVMTLLGFFGYMHFLIKSRMMAEIICLWAALVRLDSLHFGEVFISLLSSFSLERVVE